MISCSNNSTEYLGSSIQMHLYIMKSIQRSRFPVKIPVQINANIFVLIAVIFFQSLIAASTMQIDPFQPTNDSLEIQLSDEIDFRYNEIRPMNTRCAAAELELDRCSAQLIAFGQNHALYPNSMEELNDVYCPEFKKNIDCIKNSTECYRPFEKQIINWILTSTRRMNHKRCKNESEKGRFLKLTKSCFSPMRNPMDRCMGRYIANLEAIADFNGVIERQIEDDLQIQLSCCANMRFKSCVMSNAKQQCKPVDSLNKLKRTNSNSSQRMAHRSVQRATMDMMEDLRKTLDSMALTGPEFICQRVDEQFCKSNFDGRFHGRSPRHRSIVPAMIKIYSNN